MVKMISWNIARRKECWRTLADSDADVALLQEAIEPPDDMAASFDINPAPWETVGAGKNRPWRTAIVKLSDKVEVKWHESKPITEALAGELGVSRPGTLSVATIQPTSSKPFFVASMYALWEQLHKDVGSRYLYRLSRFNSL